MRAHVPWLLALSVLNGCSTPAQTSAAPTPGTAPPVVKAPEPAAAKPASPLIAPAEVDALLNAWRSAQNSGDFAAYSALYAKRFTGVRRSGERTVRLPREGWLKDRARMFRSPHQVVMSEPTISWLPTGMAKVRFEQTWTSSSYSDRGEKELLLSREEGTVRVLYEELLRSERAGGVESSAGDTGYFALHADALFAYVGDGVMGKPHGKDLARKGTVATASIAAGDVPAEIAKLVGRRVRALTRDGKSCAATLGELKYVLEVVTYEALGAMEDHERVLSEAEIAEAMWEMASRLSIGAQVRLDEGSACDPEQVVWVRSSDTPVEVGTPIDEAPYREAALSRVRAHRKYKALDRAHRRFDDSGESWESAAGAAVQAFRFGSRTFVSLAMPNPACTAFVGSLWATFEADADGTLKPIFVIDDAPTLIDLLFDEDGDGAPDFVTAEYTGVQHRSSTGATLGRRQPDVYVCGC